MHWLKLLGDTVETLTKVVSPYKLRSLILYL